MIQTEPLSSKLLTFHCNRHPTLQPEPSNLSPRSIHHHHQSHLPNNSKASEQEIDVFGKSAFVCLAIDGDAITHWF